MFKEFFERHRFAIGIILLILLLLLNSYDYFKVKSNRSDYIKVSGEVIDKYSQREGIGRNSVYTDYLDVSFEYEGETYFANGIKANFWEDEGDNVTFYISQDGKAYRGAFTMGLWEFLLLLFTFIFVIRDIWKKRHTIFAGSTPVVPLTDQSSYNTSDTFVSSNTYSSADTYSSSGTYSSADTYSSSGTYSSADTYRSPDVQVSPSYQEATTNINSVGTQTNTSYQSRSEASSTNNTEKEASFHDIPVIAIPDEYL